MPSSYTEMDAKSLLRNGVLVDPWFLGRFGLNLYRGCEHGCAYCDGRAERYYIEGDFQRDIIVKRNAVELARREVKRIREPGFLFLGGGVSDSYQPAEVRYQLAREMLKVALDERLSVHVLTKSALVERDFDLLEEIARERRVIVSFSLHTVNESICEIMEPGAASASQRLRLLSEARARRMHAGIMAMPVLPGLSDTQPQIEETVRAAADAGAQFVCFGSLTLRPGRQKDYYTEVLRTHWPELVAGYDRAYARNLPSGAVDPRFNHKVTLRYAEALNKYGLSARIPRATFQNFVPVYTEASVLLEHRETAEMLRGRVLRLAGSGHALAKWAHKRLVELLRRKSASYRDVELEFRARLAEGSLTQIEGVSEQAVSELRRLGFAGAPKPERAGLGGDTRSTDVTHSGRQRAV